MKPTRNLRQVLADSHVATVSIFVLLLWSIDGAFHALWAPSVRAVAFLYHAIAVLGWPAGGSKANLLERDSMYIFVVFYSYAAVASFTGAWTLSRWVYGIGPFQALNECCRRFMKRQNA
jgi:hypothetical protein